MEQDTQDQQHLFDLQIDPAAGGYLGEAANWARFLAIIGFVFCGVAILVALFAGSFMAGSFNKMGMAGTGSMGGMLFSVIYLCLAVLYFFPCLYLNRFAMAMRVALRNNDGMQLTRSFKGLKSCFRFLGILTIIILAIYVLAIAGGIMAAATASMH